MKHVVRLIGSSVGIVLLLSLGVVLAASAGWLRRQPASVAAPSPAVRASATAAPPAATASASSPAPARPPQAGGGQIAPPTIPACTFAGGPPHTAPTSTLDQYTFGPPEIVLAGPYMGIDGWLPDSQRLLVTQQIPDPARQRLAVKTVDVRSKAEQGYGERSTPTRAVWLSAEQAVAFAETQRDGRVLLRLGRGAGAPVEELAADLAVPYVSARPDGHDVTVFATNAPGQPQTVAAGRAAQRGRRVLGPALQAMEQPVEVYGDRTLRTAWRPDGRQLAVFNVRGFYLLDVASGRVCTVDLGSTAEGLRWARDVRWSPDGRLIAARTSISESEGSVPFLHLTVLDTVTGELRQITLDVRFVDEAEWLPTSQQLLVKASIAVDGPEQRIRQGLFLVDVVSGAFRRVLPDTTFGFGYYSHEGGGLAVAPDGRLAAISCPLWPLESGAIIEDRICTIPITLQP